MSGRDANQLTDEERAKQLAWLDSLDPDRYAPRCPQCGEKSADTLYAATFHEHTCLNGHVWRIY